MNRLYTYLLLLPLLAVSASAAILYDNGVTNPANTGAEATQYLEADDFSIAAGGTVTSVGVYIATTFPTIPSRWDGTIDYFFYADAPGLPGSLLASGSGQNIALTDTGLAWPFGGNEFLLEFDLMNPFAAAAGTTYWMAIHLASDFSDREDIYWTGTDSGGNIHSSYLGTDPWDGASGYAAAFYLSDEPVGEVPEPTTMLLFGGGLAALFLRRRKTLSN